MLQLKGLPEGKETRGWDRAEWMMNIKDWTGRSDYANLARLSQDQEQSKMTFAKNTTSDDDETRRVKTTCRNVY